MIQKAINNAKSKIIRIIESNLDKRGKTMPVAIGKKAPDFTTKDHEGKEFTLSSIKGKEIILYFYPKDDTPGCTKEACSFRDNISKLKKKGIEVFGVSPDNEESHQKFIKKYSLPFKLISDTDKHVSTLYGVYGEKSMYGKKYMGIFRTTFLIDKEGIIKDIIKDVDCENAAEQLLEKY